MDPSTALHFVATAFFVLGAVFWLVGFAVGRGGRSSWRSAVGRWARFESGMTRSWVVEFEAEDGQTYRIFPLMNSTSLNHDAMVPVSYDPVRPSRAVIDTMYQRGGVLRVVGPVVMGLGPLIAAVALLAFS